MSKQEIASRLAVVVTELGLADDPALVEDDGKCWIFFAHPQIEHAYVAVERPDRIWVASPDGPACYRGEAFAIAALQRLESPAEVLERGRENPMIAERLAKITKELGIDSPWGDGGVGKAAGSDDCYLVMFSHPRVTASGFGIDSPSRIRLLDTASAAPTFTSEADAAAYLRSLTLTAEETAEREQADAARAVKKAAVAEWEESLRPPTPEEFTRIRKIAKDAAPMLSRWAWIEDRFHDGSDEYTLGLVASRRKHLMNAHHALRSAGFAVCLAQAHYTAAWTGTPGGLGDVVVFEDLTAPDDMEWDG